MVESFIEGQADSQWWQWNVNPGSLTPAQVALSIILFILPLNVQ